MTWVRRRVPSSRAGGDDGQLTLLIIGFTLIAVLLVTVVVNVSRVFLAQRALSSAVDGAAVAAANALDARVVYEGRVTEDLPLAQAEVTDATYDYVGAAGVLERFDSFTVLEASTDGATATVTFGARVRLPFVNLVSADWADGYPLSVTASARSPLTGP